MTRLHDALERAQALIDEGAANQPAEPAPAHEPPAGVPPTWQLDDVPPSGPPVAEQQAAPGLPETWQLDDVAAAAEGAEPEDVDEAEKAAEPDFQYRLPSTKAAAKLIVGPTMDPTLVEQYRRLAATLHHVQLRTGEHTVMIASAAPAEGKTLTAT